LKVITTVEELDALPRMSVVDQAVLPPIVLQQQKAIDAALALADGWDEEAAALQSTAAYTRVHGGSMVADRYAMRGHTLTGMAKALREALETAEQ
jgi:hypothetical protein